jgi:hypothetical protein
MLPTPTLIEANLVTGLLRDANGDVRAALVCWGMVLSAFVILRIPREVLLGCLIAAGTTVALAVAVVEVTPEKAVASARTSEGAVTRDQMGSRLRGAGATPVERELSR